ncbi:hypothetical protein ACFXKF_32940 [Streptomyces scopuliridis]|uniref:hypothetical protein n=1 Tax=Streptomyces scopuliridis TaxID=452529 RepID=UPI0036B854DB
MIQSDTIPLLSHHNSYGEETAAEDNAPPMPGTAVPAAEMDDDQIAAESDALLRWCRRHLLHNGAGPHIPQAERTHALSVLAGRRSELHQVQKRRTEAALDIARKERAAKEKADNIARARFGKRREDGSYSVSADKLGDLGTVKKSRSKWAYRPTGSGPSALEYATRKEAAGMLVWVGDLRAAAAARQIQQDAARHQVPAGWEFGDWEDLADHDIIRSPVYGRAEDDTLYPRAWRRPVEVRRVSRPNSQFLVVSVAQLNDGYCDPLVVAGQDMLDVGFLWPTGRVRPRAQPHREKLRVRMSSILDDVSFVSKAFVGRADRIGHLMDLLDELSRSRTEDLFAGLRAVVAETAWLAEEIESPAQSYESRSRASWARVAHVKSEQAIEEFGADPDFAWAASTH